MTKRSSDGTLLGYGASIAEAIGRDDDAVLDLVEDFMRTETGGTLDSLDRVSFDRLARVCMADVLAWDVAGDVNGVTLADYCQTMGLTYPAALDERRRRLRDRTLIAGGEPAQDPAPHHPRRNADLWDGAKALAAQRGETVSDVIRSALEDYVAAAPHQA